VKKFGRVGEFCPNPNFPDFGKIQSEQQRNIKKNCKNRKSVQRYQCKTCGRTFTETFGTIFYHKRTPEHEVLEILALFDEGARISSLARATGHKEDTILRWLREAAQHAEQVEEVLMTNFKVKCGQLAAYGSPVG